MSAVSTARKKTKTRSEELQRIPGNPKYQNVKSLVDSGTNVRKYLDKIKESRKSLKQDEIFKRIRLSSFVTLMIQAAKEDLWNVQTGPKERMVLEANTNERISSLASVISGVGELDIKHSRGSVLASEFSEKPNAACPFLLLDVRDVDEYQKNHIITAKHFPVTLLCRTCNYETKELLNYKNRAGRIVVLYDYDETIARRSATTLVQRGYDNVYLLIGGLKLAIEKLSTGFVTGKLPDRETIVEDRDSLSASDVAILEVQLDRFLMTSAGSSQFRTFRTPSIVEKSKVPVWR